MARWKSVSVFVGVVSLGCTTAQKENDAILLAQLKLLNERQAVFEQRLDSIENQIKDRKSQSTPPMAASKDFEFSAPRDLATIHLTPPGYGKAPALPTSVLVKEPSAETLEQISSENSSESYSENGLDENSPESFRSAMASISTGNVESGVRALINFADKNPKHELAATALYNAGMGMEISGDLKGALLVFRRVSDDYPLAAEAPDAMVRMAECLTRTNNVARAREIYSYVQDRYPSTLAARTAQSSLQNLAVMEQ